MAKAITSPLVSSFNSIASYNGKTKRDLSKMQSEYKSFSTFLVRETKSLQTIKLPPKRKIKELANLNVANNFGNIGNLLRSLVGGALDVGGFLGNMFPGKGKLGEPSKISQKASKQAKPIPRGKGLRFTGLRSIGIVNSIFAGLDFATGLAGGESIGKSAAGTGGALAGSLLGGAIGQTLIPIPGVGFVIGSMAGNFVGGFAADRAYEGVTGEKSLEQKQRERLKAQEQKQKGLSESSGGFKNALDKFSSVVDKFSDFAMGFSLDGGEIGPGTYTDNISADPNNVGPGVNDQGVTDANYPGFDNVERVAPFVTGHVSTYGGAQFGAPRSRGSHAGQDIADQKAGDPVLAAMAGTVVEVGRGYAWQKGGGSSQTIGIKHKDGTMTRYVHVMSNVSVGTEVKTGQKIGTISPADSASSPDFPHLHFELYNTSGKIIDPRPFLRTAPKTPSVAPIKTGTQAVAAPGTSMNGKFTANDIGAAPMLTIGDSIAKGSKDSSGSAGTATVGATPKDVMSMLQGQDLNGKLVRLSSGISNDTSDLSTVRQQLQYAQKMGAKGVQLMGTSVDRADLSPLNAKLQALANEFPGFVQFGGGFNAKDKVHPDYAKYNDKLQNLLKSSVGGMGGMGVDPSMFAPEELAKLGKNISDYPEYNSPGSSIVLIPISQQSQTSSNPPSVITASGGNGNSTTVLGASPSQVVNSLMKSLLLTNLSQT
jgi:murein DD-endopeptidase MepM/ murein hydrolase activator NlpD